MNHLRSLL